MQNYLSQELFLCPFCFCFVLLSKQKIMTATDAAIVQEISNRFKDFGLREITNKKAYEHPLGPAPVGCIWVNGEAFKTDKILSIEFNRGELGVTIHHVEAGTLKATLADGNTDYFRANP